MSIGMRDPFIDSEASLIDLMGASTIKGRIRIEDDKWINYVCLGKGKPILFLHGANIGWGQWYKNLAYFAKKYAVFAIDFPGSGDSYNLDFMHSNVPEVFLDALERFVSIMNLKELVIVGHSIGGLVAMMAAKKMKEIRKLILINPVGLVRDVNIEYRLLSFPLLRMFMKAFVFKSDRKGIERFLLDAQYDKTIRITELVEYYYASIKFRSQQHPLDLVSVVANWKGVKDEFLFLRDISLNSTNTLIILGERDSLTPRQMLLSAINKNDSMKTVIVENTAHVPFLEKPTLVNHIIDSFLD